MPTRELKWRARNNSLFPRRFLSTKILVLEKRPASAGLLFLCVFAAVASRSHQSTEFVVSPSHQSTGICCETLVMLSGVGAHATTQSKHPEDAGRNMPLQGVLPRLSPLNRISRPQCSARSCQRGLAFSTSVIFFPRRYPFNCFSRLMAQKREMHSASPFIEWNCQLASDDSVLVMVQAAQSCLAELAAGLPVELAAALPVASAASCRFPAVVLPCFRAR